VESPIQSVTTGGGWRLKQLGTVKVSAAALARSGPATVCERRCVCLDCDRSCTLVTKTRGSRVVSVAVLQKSTYEGPSWVQSK
jgi:hypothetical protein